MFIWTEAFNCGELLTPFLKSYIQHNDQKINVYGFKNDLIKIEFSDPRVVLHDLEGILFDNSSMVDLIDKSYKKGHQGTALLWAWLIKSRPEENFVHLDADTIFLENVITDFETAIDQGYMIAGSRRPYRNRTYRKNGIDGWLLNRRKDTLNTDCFYFNTSKLKKIPFFWLVRMIRGRRIGLLPVVDFFDPIIFKLLRKKQRILYLDSPSCGFQSESNSDSLFHRKRISFAAVGSGLNFYKNPEIETSPGYKGFALASYSLYSKMILEKEIPIEPLKDNDLEQKLKRLNTEKWDLSK
jgi:hypothetical protein